MPTKITATDFKKGATYAHKHVLKEHGFRWSPGEGTWIYYGEIDDDFIYELVQIGIKITPIDYLTHSNLRDMYEEDTKNIDDDKQNAKINPDDIYGYEKIDAPKIELLAMRGRKEETDPTGFITTEKVDGAPRATLTFDLEVYSHAYPDTKFTHGAYLHSRAKSGKPIDSWYKNKLVKEAPMSAVMFLLKKVSKRTRYVIISIQENEYKERKYESVWVFFVDESDVIIDRAKIKIEKKKEGDTK